MERGKKRKSRALKERGAGEDGDWGNRNFAQNSTLLGADYGEGKLPSGGRVDFTRKRKRLIVRKNGREMEKSKKKGGLKN